MNTPTCLLQVQSKIKTIGHAITCRSLIFSCNSKISHSMTYRKFRRKGPKLLKILKTEHFSCSNNPPWQPRPQSKIKTIRHQTTCDIIISCNSNISHFLTCPKFKGNPNSQGTLNWIIQILHYYSRMQQKDIVNSQIIEQNLVISLSFSVLLTFYYGLRFLHHLSSRVFSVL